MNGFRIQRFNSRCDQNEPTAGKQGFRKTALQAQIIRNVTWYRTMCKFIYESMLWKKGSWRIQSSTVSESVRALSSSWLSALKDERQSANCDINIDTLKKALQGFPCIKKRSIELNQFEKYTVPSRWKWHWQLRHITLNLLKTSLGNLPKHLKMHLLESDSQFDALSGCYISYPCCHLIRLSSISLLTDDRVRICHKNCTSLCMVLCKTCHWSCNGVLNVFLGPFSPSEYIWMQLHSLALLLTRWSWL